jgi:CDP-6-deoxy-D-xylo-4-hexulose-3-dehydrase
VAAGFPTTVNPILQFGAVPVFVDVDLPTHNIDASLIEAAIGPKTKAIMLAHSLGNPFNLEVVTALCKKHGLWLVEDCCDALGSHLQWPHGGHLWRHRHAELLPRAPHHHGRRRRGVHQQRRAQKHRRILPRLGPRLLLRAGQGQHLRQSAFAGSSATCPDGYDHKYTYSHLGYNLKITDMQAACGWRRLERLDGSSPPAAPTLPS